MDHKYKSNMARLRGLTCHRETERWTMNKFVAAHKQHHNIQTKLHREHKYQGIPGRDKVNYFINGIRNLRMTPALFRSETAPHSGRNLS